MRECKPLYVSGCIYIYTHTHTYTQALAFSQIGKL